MLDREFAGVAKNFAAMASSIFFIAPEIHIRMADIETAQLVIERLTA